MPDPSSVSSAATPSPSISSIESLRLRTASLLIYSSVLNYPAGEAFLTLIDTLYTETLQAKALQAETLHGEAHHTRLPDAAACLRAYGRWFNALAEQGQSWRTGVMLRLLTDENPFTRQAQQGRTDSSPSLRAAVGHDLKVLQELSQCSGAAICQWLHPIGATGEPDILPQPVAWMPEDEAPAPEASPGAIAQLRSLPIWKTLEEAEDWSTLVDDLAQHHARYGTGRVAEYLALRWQAGELRGIAYPDPISLDDLTAYDLPRQALIRNTEALLAGYRALHVLLYGSRGSGKSSLVKALLMAYGDRGLRLVEVSKADLRDLPLIVDQLRLLPQRFIIFVDDLSFEEDDDAFKALKVVLEGSVTARPQNVVVYATSNRRHLIREFHDERPRPRDAEEIHAWDTVQEKLSFSDRFGLTLTFEPADQSTYLTIVHHLAQRAGIELPPEDLEYRALQWATRHNGRSGRSARQFVDALVAELALSTKHN